MKHIGASLFCVWMDEREAENIKQIEFLAQGQFDTLTGENGNKTTNPDDPLYLLSHSQPMGM